MSQAGLALGLALVSLMLPVGWQWLKDKRVGLSELAEQGWEQVARFFYFVGLPYLAVITGLIPARWLGLKGLEYFVSAESLSLTWLVSEAQKAVTFVLLEGLLDAGRMIGAGCLALLILAGICWSLARHSIGLATNSEGVILASLYQAVHWAFYRAVFWLVTGDLYLGTILGVGFVLVEQFILAWLQQTWLARQPERLLEMIILILTATLFFYSPNLWLLWPFHLAMLMLSRRIGMVQKPMKLA